MTEDMIERVARAIAKGMGEPWRQLGRGAREDYMETARAAIEAMRDIPEEILYRPGCGEWPDEMRACWHFMIDAALNPRGRE